MKRFEIMRTMDVELPGREAEYHIEYDPAHWRIEPVWVIPGMGDEKEPGGRNG